MLRPSKDIEADHEFLLKGGVLTKGAIEVWIDYKRSKEVDALRLVRIPPSSPVLRHLSFTLYPMHSKTGTSRCEVPVFL